MRRRWRRRERRRWTPEQYRKGMYILPSLFTVSNIFCGFYSISAAIRENYEIAGILIGIAMILDTLDGRLARMTNTASDFGVQLDSLADVHYLWRGTSGCLLSIGVFRLRGPSRDSTRRLDRLLLVLDLCCQPIGPV